MFEYVFAAALIWAVFVVAKEALDAIRFHRHVDRRLSKEE